MTVSPYVSAFSKAELRQQSHCMSCQSVEQTEMQKQSKTLPCSYCINSEHVMKCRLLRDRVLVELPANLKEILQQF